MAERISARQRIELYRTLRLMGRGKVQTNDALRHVHRTYSERGHKKLALLSQEAMMGLASGKSLAESLDRWIPEAEAAILAAGERSGELPRAFDDATKLIKRKSRMYKAVTGGAAYPIFMLLMIGGFLFFIAYKFIPSFARVKDPHTWTGAAALLNSMATAVRDYGLMTVVILAAAVIVTWYTMGRWSDGLRVKFDRFPPWSTYRTIQGAVFLSNLAVMLRAGAQMQQALLFMMQHASPWLRTRIQAALYGIGQGRNMGQALIDADYDFPSRDSLPFLALIAEQDGFESGLSDFSEDWMEYVTEQFEAGGKVFFIVGIFVVAVILGVVWAGMASLQNSIGS